MDKVKLRDQYLISSMAERFAYRVKFSNEFTVTVNVKKLIGFIN